MLGTTNQLVSLMRERIFVKQNADKWRTFEESSVADPDVLSERYIELTDDLAYARTFYPDLPVTKYLNDLTAQFHRKIYQNKRESRSRIITFWKEELPLLLYECRAKLLYSALMFGIGALIGAFSAAYDDTFVRLILGDSYVNMTLENIEKGDPLAVYKSAGQVEMFFGITINNIRVSFLAFVAGVLFSVGTFWLLFQNGVMLGAFQFFFYQKGILLTSVLTIWIHGTLEISAIVIAGAAGLVVGNSLIFPKTFSRLHSFRKGAINGLKIVIGLIPVFVSAGFLESFVTRLSLHPLVSSSIILLSATFIITYFLIYPIIVHRNSFAK